MSVQLSVTVVYLTFPSRVTFLSHHGQLGVSLPESKIRAIMTGDLSGTHVHPSLIYVAQLMGCRLWQEQNRTVLNSAVEHIQLLFVFQALLDTPDPVTRLQIHSVLAIYFLIKRQMQEGRDQLLRAARVALEYNMRFDTHSTETLEPMLDTSDEVQEHICALSQLMYLDKAAAIVLNDPSLLSTDYDQQFKALPVARVPYEIDRPWLTLIFAAHISGDIKEQPSCPTRAQRSVPPALPTPVRPLDRNHSQHRHLHQPLDARRAETMV